MTKPWIRRVGRIAIATAVIVTALVAATTASSAQKEYNRMYLTAIRLPASTGWIGGSVA
jgi:hypothetical protein